MTLPWYIWITSAFIIYFFGTITGIFLIALCHASKRGDEMLEEMEKQIKEDVQKLC